MRSLAVLVPALALLAWPAAAGPDRAQPADAAFVEKELRPFLHKLCLGCHGETKPKADLSLAAWKDPAAVKKDAAKLDAALQQLREQTMPPEGKPQPTAEERAKILAGLERLASTTSAGPASPGRVTIRRLNRAEYNNTVRDLLLIDFKPAEDFPNDDVGHGFDHIGDVLTLSPLLMEKYLRAAERIAAEGLTLPPPPKPGNRRILAREFKAEPNSARFVGERQYRAIETGLLRANVDLPDSGFYRFNLQALAEPAGDEKAKLTLQIDGKDVRTFVLQTAYGQSYSHELELPAGRRALRLVFANPFTEPADAAKSDVAEGEKGQDRADAKGDPKDKPAKPKVRRVAVEYLELVGPLRKAPPPPPPSYVKLFGTPAGPKEAKRDWAQRLIAPLAERAFRRPVSSAEIDRLLALFDRILKEGGSPEDGVRGMVQALLVSPHFLFRAELRSRPLQDGAVEELDSYALASRLSYFLWSSLPDEELFRLAKEDRLRAPETLAAQAERMLKDPKSQALTENFAGQWLQLRSLAQFSPDAARFPGFDDELRDALRREAELFFQAMLAENRPIGDFLDADFAFMNQRLAEHYGLPKVEGPEFRRVKLEDANRGGLLTQGAMLCVTSNPTRTSPVKRGKWILENLLASPPPPPPPGAGDLADDEKTVLSGSLRQRMEQHRANPTCASCHARMDPLGFALENFDAVGRWRTKDGAFEIDPAGSLPNGQTFRNIGELKQVLKKRLPDFRRCLCEKMLTYALGRGLEPSDRAAVAALAAALERQGDRFGVLPLLIVRSEAFRTRQPLGR